MAVEKVSNPLFLPVFSSDVYFIKEERERERERQRDL
jgi:hypothetical protein